jgi:redox-sensitive bicupin YhaK (pirin superfamily)
MITLHANASRGRGSHGWLTSAFSFSFADYYNPDMMGFRALRVINDDYIKPASGFPTHSHHNMEIVTYVLSGELEHKDSTGHASIIKPGTVQRMSAGSGVRHSEYNHSPKDDLHLLQIWLLPEADGINPGYEEKPFSPSHFKNKLGLICSRDARHGSLTIHQDVAIYASQLEAGHTVSLPLAAQRHAWIQVAEGKISMNGTLMEGGDGAAISAETKLEITAASAAEFLLFDLA